MNKESNFQLETAKQYLILFGNKRPTPRQLMLMKDLLFHVWLQRDLTLVPKLSKREKQCLYYASQGKTIEETALLLGLHEATVETYRKQVVVKLDCRNMYQAISVGIRYGEK